MLLNNIGNIYNNQGDYLKSIEYSKRALDLHMQTNNNRGIATDCMNIAGSYYS